MTERLSPCTFPQPRRELSPLPANLRAHLRDFIEKGPLALNGVEVRVPARSRGGLVWAVGRRLPDLLTFSRVILALFLIWAGLVDRQAALSRDIWLLVMSWSTDMIDGRLSRSLRTAGRTWLGKHDVYVDMFVSLAVLAYLGVTGLVPVWALAVYLAVWGALFLKWGVPALFAQVFQNPIYLLFVVLTVQSAPWVLTWLLVWAGVAMVLFWRRLFELGQNVLRALAERNPGK